MTDNLEVRVKVLEDTLAIQHLKHRYLNACDAKDVSAMISTFTPSACMIDYGPVGVFKNSNDLAEVFKEVACHEYMLESHHAHNPIIKITDNDEAVGDWSLTYNLINLDNSSIVTLQGSYHDLYQRINDQWLIKETTFRGVSSLNLEMEESLLKVIFAGKP
ncbi:nuclear transport factor 2 family protein [Gammaproteobacteria bacterium]|nr:nuclear transport factor 2 family protein [Gammaproteobacteria bacterium]